MAKYEIRRIVAAKRGQRQLRSAAGSTPNTSLTIKVAKLKPGAYPYEIVARDSAGNVSRAARVTIRIAKPKPKRTLVRTPAGLHASARTASSVSLAWTAGGSSVARYRVEQRRSTGGWRTLGSLKATATSVRINSLLGGSAYTFRIRAEGRSGAVARSAPLTVRTR